MDIQLDNMKQPTLGIIGDAGAVPNQQLAKLFSDARNCLVRYKDHMIGETATLNKLIESVCATHPKVPPVQVDTISMQSAVYEF
ncbi:MAG: hypothetical protein ACRCXC_00535 [Legionella sp.]